MEFNYAGPVRGQIARYLSLLSGRAPIHFTGPRPGELVYETLCAGSHMVFDFRTAVRKDSEVVRSDVKLRAIMLVKN